MEDIPSNKNAYNCMIIINTVNISFKNVLQKMKNTCTSAVLNTLVWNCKNKTRPRNRRWQINKGDNRTQMSTK